MKGFIVGTIVTAIALYILVEFIPGFVAYDGELIGLLGIAAGLSRDAVHAQVAAGLDAVVHVARHADGMREVAALADLGTDQRGRLLVRPRLRVHRGRPVDP